MRKVKMKATAAGPNGTFISGNVYSMNDKQANEFVKGGYAEALEPLPDIEEQNGPASDVTTGTAGSETEMANQDTKEGEQNGPEGDNSTSDGTTDSIGSETAPKNRRNR